MEDTADQSEGSASDTEKGLSSHEREPDVRAAFFNRVSDADQETCWDRYLPREFALMSNVELRDSYIIALTNVTIVCALFSGFSLTVLASSFDDTKVASFTVWGDKYLLGVQVMKFLEGLCMSLSVIVVLAAVNLIQQLSQLPPKLTKQYVLVLGLNKILGIFYMAAAVYLLSVLSVCFLYTLVLAAAPAFLALVLTLVLLVGVTGMMSVPTVKRRFDLLKVYNPHWKSSASLRPIPVYAGESSLSIFGSAKVAPSKKNRSLRPLSAF